MDMDTAQKRFSTLDWDQPFQPGIAVPSGSDTAGKRQHGMWMYSGIESEAAIDYPGASVIWHAATNLADWQAKINVVDWQAKENRVDWSTT